MNLFLKVRLLLLLFYGFIYLNLAACTIDVAVTATPTAVPTPFTQPAITATTTTPIPSPTPTPPATATKILVTNPPGAAIGPITTATETAVPTSTSLPAPTATPIPTPVFTPAGEFQIVGQTGGQVKVVAVADGLAYVGIGPRLVVVDVSNPADSRQLGQSNVLPGLIRRVVVDGRFAYVATDESAIWLIDITIAENPQIVQRITVPDHVTRLRVENGILFVLGTPWLNAYKTEDLQLRGTAQMPEYTYDMDAAGDYLYLITRNSFFVLDVSDPADLSKIVATLAMSHSNDLLDVEGGHAYILGYVEVKSSGFKVIDISNPREPLLLATYNASNCFLCSEIAAGNGYVFLGSGYCDIGPCGASLDIYDVTEPANIQFVNRLNFGKLSNDLFVDGNFVYAATGDTLTIVDMNDPNQITIAGNPLQSSGYSFWTIEVAADYLYTIAARTNTFVIFDLVEPDRPTAVGTTPITGNLGDHFAVSEGMAYVTTYDPGTLQLINTENPAAPTLAGSFEPVEWWSIVSDGIAATDSYLYLTMEEGVAILDTTEPTSAQVVGYLQTGEQSVADQKSTIANNHLYLVMTDGLYIFNLSNPAAPTQVSFLEGLFDGRPAIANNHLYLNQFYRAADRQITGREITIFNIANPANPTIIGRLPGLGLTNLTIGGNYLYGIDSYQTVWAINVANPSTPYIVASTHTPGFALDLAAYGDLLYAADREGGLLVLKVQESD